MNIIFFTQSRSLDVFYQILLRINNVLSIDKVGFYVSNKAYYRNFIIQHPDFEETYNVIKEWKIYEEAKAKEVSFEEIEQYEKEIGNPNLWAPIVTDRRLYFGKKITFSQDYKPYFKYYQQMQILNVALKSIDQLFNHVRPDLICTLYTATFGDCLGHQFAEARGIRALDLRLSRLKNYVMYVDGIKEPPPHIQKIFNQ